VVLKLADKLRGSLAASRQGGALRSSLCACGWRAVWRRTLAHAAVRFYFTVATAGATPLRLLLKRYVPVRPRGAAGASAASAAHLVP